jgi:hypothetical protein
MPRPTAAPTRVVGDAPAANGSHSGDAGPVEPERDVGAGDRDPEQGGHEEMGSGVKGDHACRAFCQPEHSTGPMMVALPLGKTRAQDSRPPPNSPASAVDFSTAIPLSVAAAGHRGGPS